MKKIIYRLLGIELPLIKRIWYDNERYEFLMHTNCRSGLFHAPTSGGKNESYWLVDYSLTKDLPKDETIYKLMDIKEIKKETP